MTAPAGDPYSNRAYHRKSTRDGTRERTRAAGADRARRRRRCGAASRARPGARRRRPRARRRRRRAGSRRSTPTKIIAVHLTYRSRLVEYAVARMPARAVVLPQAAETLNGHLRAGAPPGRHALPQLRGRARGDRRPAHARRRASATCSTTSTASPPPTTSACTTSATPTAARCCASRVRTASCRSAPPCVTADEWRPDDGYTLRTRLNGEVVQEADAVGPDLGLPLPARRPVPADHARAGRRDPDRHAGQLAADGARRRRRGRDLRHARAAQPGRGLGRRPAAAPASSRRSPPTRCTSRSRSPRTRRSGSSRKGGTAEPRAAHGAGAQRVLDDDLAARAARARRGWRPRPRTPASTR